MLEVLDTAGQEEYTALRDQWIRDGEGFVLVYSITSRNSFSRIQRFHSQIQRVKESSNAGSPTGPSYLTSQMPSNSYGGPVPVMLVGNKSDKQYEREVSSAEGLALARELGCEFVEASAKNCINVEKAAFQATGSKGDRIWLCAGSQPRSRTSANVSQLGQEIETKMRHLVIDIESDSFF
jgi:GTPase KRas protein